MRSTGTAFICRRMRQRMMRAIVHLLGVLSRRHIGMRRYRMLRMRGMHEHHRVTSTVGSRRGYGRIRHCLLTSQQPAQQCKQEQPVVAGRLGHARSLARVYP